MNKLSIHRRKTCTIQVWNVAVGGDAPVSVQSMTKTRTEKIDDTVSQIRALSIAGCEIVRCAVPSEKAAKALKEIIAQISIPLVADIHFNYRLTLLALESGIDKIRINPGNIGDATKIEKVLKSCKERNVPIRIGVNAGSLPQNVLKKYGNATPEAREADIGIACGKNEGLLMKKGKIIAKIKPDQFVDRLYREIETF